MELLAPAAGLALLSLPAIALLYFLRIRRPPVTSAAIQLWRRQVSDRTADTPWQRLRPSLLLFLQLAAALMLALALVRPAISVDFGRGPTTVVLLDASATMRATDVKPNRFGVAVERARDMVSHLGQGEELAVVLVGPHARLLAPPTSDHGKLESALSHARAEGARGDLGEGLSLADALLAGRAGGRVVMFGDGGARALPGAARVGAPFTYVRVGSSGANTGIEALSLREDGSVYLRLVNHGPTERSLKVQLRGDGRELDVLPVRLPGGSRGELTWDRLPPGTEILEARIESGDVFPEDDVAWLVTAPPRERQVLLISRDGTFLQEALELRTGAFVTNLDPDRYRPPVRDDPGSQYDLYVFDRFLPPGRLPTPALVVAPPEGSGPLPAGPSVDPGGVLPAAPRDALLGQASLQDLHVQAAAQVKPAPGWRTVIAAAGGPLLLVHEGEPRLAELTFDLHRSDLPLHAAFPILVQNLLGYLMPGGFEGRTYHPGDAVPIVADQGARWVEVRKPDGSVQRVPPSPPRPFTDTNQLGPYSVRQLVGSAVQETWFVVRIDDPSLSDVAPGPAPKVDRVEERRGAGPAPALREIWPLLAAAALGLVVIEWLAYHRG